MQLKFIKFHLLFWFLFRTVIFFVAFLKISKVKKSVFIVLTPFQHFNNTSRKKLDFHSFCFHLKTWLIKNYFRLSKNNRNQLNKGNCGRWKRGRGLREIEETMMVVEEEEQQRSNSNQIGN